MQLSDKIAKMGESLTVNLYDNGFMVEVPGRADDGDWVTAKILASTIDEVCDLIKEAVELPRDN